MANEIEQISPSTLSRVENGKMPDMETFLRLCDWLGVPASEFLMTTDASQLAVGSLEDMGHPERIELQLRASKALDEATAQALADLVRAVSRRREDGKNIKGGQVK